jgi:gliding motility-associated-like protein
MSNFLKIIAVFVVLGMFPSLLFAQISVNFKADTTLVCPNYAIQFTDQSIGDTIFNWHWNFGDGTIDSIQNPMHAYSTPGKYTVNLTASSSNATQTKTITNYILVRDFPEANILFSDTMFLPSYLIYFHGQVINHDTLPYWYYWSFDNSSFEQGDTIAIHLFNSEGLHSASFLVKAGAGCVDTSTITIDVKDTIEVPNIFTPNNDGFNDIFTVKTNGYNDFNIEIFNRWGAMVYTVTAKRIRWDGYTDAGVQVPSGVYYYHITSPDIKGYKKSGSILLIR